MTKNKPLPGSLKVIGKDRHGRKLTVPVRPVVNGVKTNNSALHGKKMTVKKCRENTERYMDAVGKCLSVAHAAHIKAKQDAFFGKQKAASLRASGHAQK